MNWVERLVRIEEGEACYGGAGKETSLDFWLFVVLVCY